MQLLKAIIRWARRDAIRRAAGRLVQARQPDQAGQAVTAGGAAMREAASDLQAAAQAAEARLAGSSLPDDQTAEAEPATEPSPTDPSGSPRPPESPRPPDGRESGRGQRIHPAQDRADLGELPGHLRTEILQSSQGRYRQDYARLIQLYFREIAAGAAGKTP